MTNAAVEHDVRGLPGLVVEMARLGVSLHGFADVSGLFSGEWGEWPRAISLLLALPIEALRDVWSGGPTPAYYDAYLVANARLNAASRKVADRIRHLGYRARPYPATDSAAELESDLGAALMAPVHHKAVATRRSRLDRSKRIARHAHARAARSSRHRFHRHASPRRRPH